MQLILKQLLETRATKIEEETTEKDEVSFVYYGDQCSCSKTAKCKTSKCICYIRGVKCGPDCHGALKTSCTNK